MMITALEAKKKSVDFQRNKRSRVLNHRATKFWILKFENAVTKANEAGKTECFIEIESDVSIYLSEIPKEICEAIKNMLEEKGYVVQKVPFLRSLIFGFRIISREYKVSWGHHYADEKSSNRGAKNAYDLFDEPQQPRPKVMPRSPPRPEAKNAS